MWGLKVLLSHPYPYPLYQSVEPPRRNVLPRKDCGMKISHGGDSWSHLFPLPSPPVSDYIITSPRANPTWSQCSSLKRDGDGIRTACIHHTTLSVLEDGQRKTDINKITQMVDKHLRMKIHVVIDFFCFTPFSPPLRSPLATPNYSWVCWSLFRAKKKKNTFLHCQHFRISLPFFFFFLSLVGYASDFHSSMLCSLAFEATVHFKAIPPRANG